MTGIVGFITRDTLTPLLAFEAERMVKHAEDELQALAVEIVAYAQGNAPWTDRTGAARAGLEASVDRDGTEIVLTLYHTVDYGQWLELIQSGRFAIIMPTLEHFAAEAMQRTHAEESGGDLSDA